MLISFYCLLFVSIIILSIKSINSNIFLTKPNYVFTCMMPNAVASWCGGRRMAGRDQRAEASTL